MTTSAQLGVARQSVQLRINQTETKVRELENLASGGASWNQIDSGWNTVNNELTSQFSELDNLQKQNAGLNGDVIWNSLDPGMGYDARANKQCDMVKAGIIDPTKVTRVAIEHAASVASMISCNSP